MKQEIEEIKEILDIMQIYIRLLQQIVDDKDTVMEETTLKQYDNFNEMISEEIQEK